MSDYGKKIMAIIVIAYFIACIITLILLLIECEKNNRDWRRYK